LVVVQGGLVQARAQTFPPKLEWPFLLVGDDKKITIKSSLEENEILLLLIGAEKV